MKSSRTVVQMSEVGWEKSVTVAFHPGLGFQMEQNQDARAHTQTHINVWRLSGYWTLDVITLTVTQTLHTAIGNFYTGFTSILGFSYWLIHFDI